METLTKHRADDKEKFKKNTKAVLEKNKTLEADKEKFRGEIDELRHQTRDVDAEEIENLRTEKDELLEKNEELEKKAKKANSLRRTEVENLQKLLDEKGVEKESIDSAAEIADLKSQLEASEANLEDVKKHRTDEKEKFKKQAKNLLSKNKRLEDEIDEYRFRTPRENEKMDRMREENDDLSEKVEELERECSSEKALRREEVAKLQTLLEGAGYDKKSIDSAIEVTELRSKCANLELEFEVVKKARAKDKQNAAQFSQSLMDTNKELSHEKEQLRKEAEELREKAEDGADSEELEKLQEENDELMEKNEDLEHDLREEKQLREEEVAELQKLLEEAGVDKKEVDETKKTKELESKWRSVRDELETVKKHRAKEKDTLKKHVQSLLDKNKGLVADKEQLEKNVAEKEHGKRSSIAEAAAQQELLILQTEKDELSAQLTEKVEKLESKLKAAETLRKNEVAKLQKLANEAGVSDDDVNSAMQVTELESKCRSLQDEIDVMKKHRAKEKENVKKHMQSIFGKNKDLLEDQGKDSETMQKLQTEKDGLVEKNEELLNKATEAEALRKTEVERLQKLLTDAGVSEEAVQSTMRVAEVESKCKNLEDELETMKKHRAKEKDTSKKHIQSLLDKNKDLLAERELLKKDLGAQSLGKRSSIAEAAAQQELLILQTEKDELSAQLTEKTEKLESKLEEAELLRKNEVAKLQKLLADAGVSDDDVNSAMQVSELESKCRSLEDELDMMKKHRAKEKESVTKHFQTLLGKNKALLEDQGSDDEAMQKLQTEKDNLAEKNEALQNKATEAEALRKSEVQKLQKLLADAGVSDDAVQSTMRAAEFESKCKNLQDELETMKKHRAKEKETAKKHIQILWDKNKDLLEERELLQKDGVGRDLAKRSSIAEAAAQQELLILQVAKDELAEKCDKLQSQVKAGEQLRKDEVARLQKLLNEAGVSKEDVDSAMKVTELESKCRSLEDELDVTKKHRATEKESVKKHMQTLLGKNKDLIEAQGKDSEALQNLVLIIFCFFHFVSPFFPFNFIHRL